MKNSRLTLFDIGSLVSRLGSSLANRDDYIEATNFVEKTPRKPLFSSSLNDREASLTTKCNLVWTAHGRGLLALAGLPKEINLGYVFLEEGYVDASSDYCGHYEALKMRTKYPLELKNGLVLPPCTIKITHESPECGVDEKPIRTDHLRRFGLFWQKTDLRTALPTEWFFHNSEYVLQQNRAYGSMLDAMPAQ